MSPPPIWPALSPSRYPALNMPPSLYTGIILSATPTWINLKTAFWSPRPHYCFHPHWKRSCSRADDSVCVIFVCRLFTLWHLSVLIGQWKWTNGLVSALTGLVWSVPSINPTGQMASVPHDWRKNHFSCLPENCEGPCPASSYWKLSYTHDT